MYIQPGTPDGGFGPFLWKVAWKGDCAPPVSSPIITALNALQPTLGNEADLPTDLKRDLIAMLPRLRRFARSLTRSVVEADDLVQDACVRAIARADQWDRTQPLDRWVFTMMRNLWISEVRKRSVRLGQGHVPAEESNELVTAETGEANLAVNEVHAAIAALPSDLSSVLLAVSVEGYSYAEAATLFEIPVGTVMSRVHRARKALAAQMAATREVSA